MKQSSFSAFSLFLFFAASFIGVFVDQAFAEEDKLFRCGNLWSNKPCEEGAKPIASLAPIGRISASEETQEEQLELSPAQPPGKREKKSPHCTPQRDGLDIRILSHRVERRFESVNREGYRVERDTRQNFVTLTVKNYSRLALESPLSVLIKDGKYEERIKIAERLGAGDEYTEDIYLSDKRVGRLVLALIFSPAKSCPKIELNIEGAAVRVDDESVDYVIDTKAFERAQLKNLKVLREDIVKYRKGERRKFNEHPMPGEEKEKFRLRNRWGELCSSSPRSTLRVREECRRIQELLE